MRKKFYLIATLAMLCWHTGNAQVTHSPRHPLFAVRAARTDGHKPVAAATDSHDGTATLSDGIKVVSRDELPKIRLKAADKVTATVLTGYTVASESGTHSVSLAYNDNGRVKSTDEDEYAGTISYVEGTHGQWIERMEQRSNKYGHVQTNATKVVRTQDEQGRIVAEKIYTTLVLEEEPLKLEHSYAYDYEQSSEDYLFVTEDIDYSNNPEGTGVRYVALPGNDIIRCEWSDYSREDVTRDGNNYVYTRKYKNDGAWATVYQKTILCDGNGNETGYIEVNSETDGTITNVYGSKTETQLNTPSDGYQTSITYSYRKADGADNVLANYSWVPSVKEVHTDNYNDEHITPDGMPRTEYTYSWDSGTQSWKETGYDINEWVKPNILKTTTTYESEGKDRGEVYYTVYSDEGEDIGSAMLFSDGGYVVMKFDETNSMAECEEFIYTVYDAQDVAQEKYKQVEHKNERTDGFKNYYSAEPTKWYVWNGGSWELATGTLRFGDGDNRLVCTLDDKGRPVEVFEYEDGKVDDHYKYTYLANGYVDETYEMKADGSDEYLSDSYTRTIDSDGNYEATEFEYTEGGYAKYGKKIRELSNGVSEIYSWRNGAFVLSSRYANNIVTEEDGVRTVINREIEGNGDNYEIVEKGKYVTIERGNEHTSEIYTKEDGKWVGQSKSSTFDIVTPDFTWRKVVPEVEYGLSYSNYGWLFDQIHQENGLNVPDSRIDYAWEDGRWVTKESSINDVKVEGNTATHTLKYDTDGYSLTETYSFKRDSQGRLLEEKNKMSTTQDGETTTTFTEFYYTFDNEGRLISEKQVSNDNGTVTITYTYGKISVVDGIGSVSANDAPKVAVNGNTITVEGCTDVALYSVDGSLADRGTDGTVTAPAKGLYILKAGKDSVKVLVK